MRCGQLSGQPLGGLVRGQRFGVTAAGQLEESTDGVDGDRHCGLDIRLDGALGMLDIRLGIFGTPLYDKRASEHHRCHASGRFVAPAVTFSEVERTPAGLRRLGKRPRDPDCRLMCQAGELQIRPPDPLR